MNEEVKRIVDGEAWSVIGPLDGLFYVDRLGASTWIEQVHDGALSEADARIISCAPEALALLLRAEFVFGPGGKRACPWCQKIITPADLHTAECPWLALMRKAGLR